LTVLSFCRGPVPVRLKQCTEGDKKAREKGKPNNPDETTQKHGQLVITHAADKIRGREHKGYYEKNYEYPRHPVSDPLKIPAVEKGHL